MVRFNLRSLFYVTAVLALLLAFGPKVYDWYYLTQAIPLADVVASFNRRAADHRIGQREPPVTESEMVTSISSQLPNLRANNEVKSIYSDIVRSRRVPQDASLNSIPGWELQDGTHYTVWWINLLT
jgi:hypothetical protein